MIKQDLMYTKTHEWGKKLEGNILEVGLTDHAQKELGDLVFINLPQEGDDAIIGESIADVESVKAVSDIYSPVSGTICAINDLLLDSPESINLDAYDAWLFRIENITEQGEWMDADTYEQYLTEEE